MGGEGKRKRPDVPGPLRGLGIVDCLPAEEDAEATMRRATKSLDLLLHHGSRFIGGPSETVHPFFTTLAQTLNVRMLLQADATNQAILGRLEDLEKSLPNFEFAFYEHPPIFRCIIIDGGATCLCSHYCDKLPNRKRGSNLVNSGPQMVIGGGPRHSMSDAMKRMFEVMWDAGTVAMWD